ncbi:hypothetical protein MAR_033085 [Mya arenaria]|uniref:Uncharacterized protein n=1 Tax=Mya arenaria TaxID=6604 RepID=A0ABY7G7Z5_MYAAR|nr:hypothetical protein MAR_033085 [Mya arenaria]
MAGTKAASSSLPAPCYDGVQGLEHSPVELCCSKDGTALVRVVGAQNPLLDADELMSVEDPLGVSRTDEMEQFLMPLDDLLEVSYTDDVQYLLMPVDDPWGYHDYFLDDLSISGPLCASTPCKPDTSRVSAVTRPQRSFKNFLEREVISAQKMKNKALEASSIADALNYKCSCNNQCLKGYTFRQIRSERKAFWEKPQFDRKKI